MRTSILAIAVVFLAALPNSTDAQAPAGAPTRHTVFEHLEDNQMVRLAGPGIGRREGRLLEHGRDELVLSSDSQPLRLPATSVDTVWTRAGSSARGAIIGAIILGAFGAYAGTEFGEENAGSMENVLGMAGIGVIGGGLLGAMIGTPISRWKRRYP